MSHSQTGFFCAFRPVGFLSVWLSLCVSFFCFLWLNVVSVGKKNYNTKQYNLFRFPRGGRILPKEGTRHWLCLKGKSQRMKLRRFEAEETIGWFKDSFHALLQRLRISADLPLPLLLTMAEEIFETHRARYGKIIVKKLCMVKLCVYQCGTIGTSIIQKPLQ